MFGREEERAAGLETKMGVAAGTNSCGEMCTRRARPQLLRFPRSMPVASLKFGSRVRAFAPGSWLRVPESLGMRWSLGGDPGCGDTPGYRARLSDGNPRDSRGQTEYLEWKRLCRSVLHNTGREGKAEWGGGWEERGKLCFWLESTSLWAVAAVMGPGGRGEACKLTPGGETRLGGAAAALSGRSAPGRLLVATSGWRLG